MASGEYVTFVSQDALPIGDDGLARMIRALGAHPRTAAATGRQVPRSAADLFCRWQIAGFDEKVLDYRTDTVVGLAPGHSLEELSPLARRRVAQINNVFCCVRRDVLVDIPFRPVPYAEDLDLGLRLLAAGYRLVFLPSVGVYHSHDRPPEYHLRRSYVDWRHLGPILGFPTRDWRAVGVSDVAELAAGLAALERQVASAVAAQLFGPADRTATAAVLAAIDRADGSAAGRGDTGLKNVLGAVSAGFSGAVRARERNAAYGEVRGRFRGVLGEVLAFAERSGGAPPAPDELAGVTSRVLAVVAGWCLADLVTWQARGAGGSEAREQLDRLLGDGV